LSALRPEAKDPRLDGGGLFIWTALIGAALGLTVWRSLSFPAYSQDMWYYLKSGEAVWRARGFPAHDLYGQGTEGAPWLRVAWLFSLGTYAVQSACGLSGLVLVRVGLCSAILLFFWLQGLRRGAPAWAAALACVLLLEGTRLLWTERPQFLSFLFFSLGIVLLDEWAAHPRRLSLYFLMALWGNLHDSTVVFVAIAAAYLLLQRLKGRSSNSGTAWDLLALVAGMLSNPGFAAPWLRLWHWSQMPPLLWQGIPEWSAPAWPAQAGFFILAALAVAIALYWAFYLRPHAPLSAANFFCLCLTLPACRSLRLLPYFLIAAYLSATAWRFWRTRFRSQFWAGLGLFALAVLGAWRWQDPGLGRYEPLWEKFPVGAAEFLAKDPPQGRLANAHWDGDYLLWRLGPEQKVFVDSRYELIYPVSRVLHSLRLFGGAPEWQDIVKGYQLSAILVPLRPLPAPIDPLLAASKRWRVAYQDGSYRLYALASEHGRAKTWP
jgi:hypothetical protein